MGKLSDILAHIFLPNKCMFCGRAVSYDQRICPACDAVKPIAPRQCLGSSPGLDELAVPFWYELGVESAVREMKFSGNLLNARKLAFYMAQRASETDWISRIDYLIPVPMHTKDQQKRGFNQAEQLGKWCSRHLGIPLRTDLLKKIRKTKAQHNLFARERQENLRDAYRAHPTLLRGKRILLIDDVVTTGSTMAECAATLRRMGAVSVCGLAAAKVRGNGILGEEADPKV